MPRETHTPKEPITLMDMQEAQETSVSREAKIDEKISLINFAFETHGVSMRATFNRIQLDDIVAAYNETNTQIDALSLLNTMYTIANSYDDRRINQIKLAVQVMNQDAENINAFNKLATTATFEKAKADVEQEIKRTTYCSTTQYTRAILVSGTIGGIVALALTRVPVAALVGTVFTGIAVSLFGDIIINAKEKRKQLKTSDDKAAKRLEIYQDKANERRSENTTYQRERVFPAIKSVMAP